MSVGGLVADGVSSIWLDIRGSGSNGDGGGSEVDGGVGSGTGAVVGGGGATGQPFSHLKPVYTKPGSGPDISRNKQSNIILNISIGLITVPKFKFKLFRVRILPLNPSHLNAPS